jgi:dipeptidase E
MTTRRIVAIGGGGFLMDDTSGLQERYLLSLCRREGKEKRKGAA